MNITIKHAGRKAEITQQSNGIPITKLFCTNGIFLRTRTFPDMGAALDFSMQWLYDMEDSRVSEYRDMLHTWERQRSI